MPELPEIEHLRCTLAPQIMGRRVVEVSLTRRDIVHLPVGQSNPRCPKAMLLLGQSITALHRHGKQLAIEGDAGGIVCVRLGMSGQLRHLDFGERLSKTSHVHCMWRLSDGSSRRTRLLFRDPRRFGGLWLFPSFEALAHAQSSTLGPDALTVGGHTLTDRLHRTHRAIKAALLDQCLIAGLGNIYTDEVLFRARIHPATPSDVVPAARARALARFIRDLLTEAIALGGTSLRDYIDARGHPGSFAMRLTTYGRAGQPCSRCGALLIACVLAGRTTVFCARCQDGPEVFTTREGKEREKYSSS